MSQGNTRLLDTITRIYKNANGNVIGIRCIHITETRDASPGTVAGEYPSLEERRKRGAEVKSSLKNFSLSIGESRQVAIIQMIGKYDEFTINGSNNDFIDVTYYGSDNVNDLIIGIQEHYETVGDTI